MLLLLLLVSDRSLSCRGIVSFLSFLSSSVVECCYKVVVDVVAAVVVAAVFAAAAVFAVAAAFVGVAAAVDAAEASVPGSSSWLFVVRLFSLRNCSGSWGILRCLQAHRTCS